jgi:tellurite resistance protein TehA-like permease
MAGFFTYLSVFLLTGIWIVGWCGVAAVCGAFFDLPLSTTALIGALLGPIGFVVVILLGIVGQSDNGLAFAGAKNQIETASTIDDVFS